MRELTRTTQQKSYVQKIERNADAHNAEKTLDDTMRKKIARLLTSITQHNSTTTHAEERPRAYAYHAEKKLNYTTCRREST